MTNIRTKQYINTKQNIATRQNINTKQIIILIIIVVISLGIGLAIGINFNKLMGKDVSQADQTVNLANDTFQAGWQAAKERLKQIGPVNQEVRIISGEVQEANGNIISIKIGPLEPLADPELDIRDVEITADTKLYQSVKKDEEQFRKEMEEFSIKMDEQIKNLSTPTEITQPPLPYIKQTINANDIKPGQIITVTSEENIKDLKEFRAIEVFVQ